MDEELMYPDRAAVSSVLTKIGVEPRTRDLDCQDLEYTTCVLTELPLYFELYGQGSTTDKEKRILGCYLLQCLEDHMSTNNSESDLQNSVFATLLQDIHIHESEIAYWCNNGWLISENFVSYQKNVL